MRSWALSCTTSILAITTGSSGTSELDLFHAGASYHSVSGVCCNCSACRSVTEQVVHDSTIVLCIGTVIIVEEQQLRCDMMCSPEECMLKIADTINRAHGETSGVCVVLENVAGGVRCLPVMALAYLLRYRNVQLSRSRLSSSGA